MEMRQCANGHFYDQSKFSDCPYCNSSLANANATRPLDIGAPLGETQGFGASLNGTLDLTAPVGGTIGETMPVGSAGGYANEGVTIGFIKKQMGIDPVVGWLVCVEGKEKGKDYRIHSDNNFLGRGEGMDICIRGDDTISSQRHAIIAYDTRNRMYYIARGEGRNTIYHNSKPLLMAAKLEHGDIIEIGNTKLMFVPLCGEEFGWK